MPRPAVAALTRWQSLALDGSAWRPVPGGSLHITLVFLGSRPPAQAARIAAEIERELPAQAPVARLAPQATAIPRRRPRALAISADAPAVTSLAAAVGRRLAAAGLHELESRPFWPHVTVARLRKHGAGRRHGGPPLPSRPLPETLRGPIRLERLVLYSSRTLATGASYEPEASFRIE